LLLAWLFGIGHAMDGTFEKGLREIFQSSTLFTSQIGDYILSSGGKRLRPKLVMVMGKAVGLAEEKILPIAYTVELMHTASLLHDDVVDNTAIRRARPTANQVFGDKPALLVGDFVTASALETMCGLGNLRLVAGIIRTVKSMSEGELKELQYAQAFHDDLDVYLDIIYLKTASLFEYCASAPGIAAGLPGPAVDALTRFGRSVGMGFQIVDDIINLTPSKDDNKDAFNDILEGKSTLPLVILFKESPSVLAEVSGIPDAAGRKDFLLPRITPDILGKCRQVALRYLDEALETLGHAGVKEEDLAWIPKAVASQLDNRF
jgi:octaprenyl-diphosphate synthase